VLGKPEGNQPEGSPSLEVDTGDRRKDSIRPSVPHEDVIDINPYHIGLW